MPQRRILVIKHGALGDIIQGLDGFASLRAGHQGDHLAVLTTPPFAGLFAAMPFFDDVLVDERASPLNLMANWRIRQIFRRGWDRIYDFQSSKRTARYFAHFVPAGVETVGRHKGASHPLPDMTGMNNRDRMVTTARIGGCPETEAETDWLVADDVHARRRVVLIPGCSPAKPQKRWAAAHYATLAQHLIDAGFTPALVGTAVDAAVGREILAQTPACENFIGQTSLVELAALLQGAALVIGNDTGPVFMAARLGAPTLMLMSCHTDPAMSAPHGKAAQWMRQDSIDTITPEAVMDQLRTMNSDL